MDLKKYKNLLTSGRWFNKDPKDAQILSLVGVDQNIADNSKKTSEKSNTYNRDSNKAEPAYIRYPSPWILEEPKVKMVNKINDRKEYSLCKEHHSGKCQCSRPAPNQ